MKTLLTSLVLIAFVGLSACDQATPDDLANHDDHDHASHASHDSHDDHDDSLVRLTASQLKEFGIEIASAKAGSLAIELKLPGEVVLNPDRVVHVAPRVPGVVSKVFKSVGDTVKQGDVLAVLDSRELARLKAEYLAATKRLEIARANFDREKKMFDGNITSESQYLSAKQVVDEAVIQSRVAERELHAVGLSEQDVKALVDQPDELLTRYEMTASLGGTIIERHITRGEVIGDTPDDPPFVIADFSNVWVHLTVYPKDLDIIVAGQKVVVTSEHGALRGEAMIAYVSPSVHEATRSATARVVLDNSEGRWRPGLFVSGAVQTAAVEGAVVIERSALQTVDGQSILFVQTVKGFEPRPVTLGRASRNEIEIAKGLRPGERYAATNTFTLKAELGRAALEHAGHVH